MDLLVYDPLSPLAPVPPPELGTPPPRLLRCGTTAWLAALSRWVESAGEDAREPPA